MVNQPNPQTRNLQQIDREVARQEKEKGSLYFLDHGFIFALITIFVVAFFGFGVFSYVRSTQTEDTASQYIPQMVVPIKTAVQQTPVVNPVDECSSKDTSGEVNSCILQASAELEDYSLCEYIEIDPAAKTECYTKAAVSAFDASICYRMNTHYTPELVDGRNACFKAAAVASKSEFACSRIMSGKGENTYDACVAAVNAASA